MLARALLVLAASFALGTALAQRPPGEADPGDPPMPQPLDLVRGRPFLWRLSRDGRHSWAFGSHPALAMTAVDAAVQAALRRSSAFVFESLISELGGEREFAEAVARGDRRVIGPAGSSDGLASAIGTEAFAAVRNALPALPERVVDRLSPGAAHYLILRESLRARRRIVFDVQIASGEPWVGHMAEELRVWATRGWRSIARLEASMSAVETAAAGTAEGLRAAAVRVPLVSPRLDQAAIDDFRRESVAYLSGNADRYRVERTDLFRVPPIALEARRAAWARRIEAIHGESAPAFVALDLDHWIEGPNALLDRLRDLGFEVAREPGAGSSELLRTRSPLARPPAEPVPSATGRPSAPGRPRSPRPWNRPGRDELFPPGWAFDCREFLANRPTAVF